MILTSRLLALLLLLILIQPASSVGAGVSPRGVAGPADPPGEMPAAQAAIGYVYTLQAGDTLWDIAASHRITVEALIAANTIANPNLLRPGDRVFVPAAAVTMARKPAAPQAAPASAPLPEPTEWAALLVRLMNEKRAAAGIAPLAWSAEVAAAAQAHADDCLRRGWGSHEGSDGARIYTRLARAGYNARWAGENWVNTHSPQVAFAFWWNEPPGAAPHRSNILNPMYRDVGIGIVKVGWGYYFFVDFGSR